MGAPGTAVQERFNRLVREGVPLSKFRLFLGNGHNPDFPSKDPTCLLLDANGEVLPRDAVDRVEKRLWDREVTAAEVNARWRELEGIATPDTRDLGVLDDGELLMYLGFRAEEPYSAFDL